MDVERILCVRVGERKFYVRVRKNFVCGCGRSLCRDARKLDMWVCDNYGKKNKRKDVRLVWSVT